MSISFEFFPPKTETAAQQLDESARHLAELHPQFVSVTCGAGGSAIDGTYTIAAHLREKNKFNVVPHVAFARQTRTRLRASLADYKKAGASHIVAIRGDASTDSDVPADDCYANTVDFVAEIKRDFALDPIVAAYPDVHPLAQSPHQDIEHLKRKIAAGATLAISQFFFLPETFLRFRDTLRAAGIDVPMAPGIMPIYNLTQIVKFAQGCGTKIPDGFAQRFDRYGADENALFDAGVAHTVALCDALRREGVGHFHFYTLNRSKMLLEVCKRLGIASAESVL